MHTIMTIIEAYLNVSLIHYKYITYNKKFK